MFQKFKVKKAILVLNNEHNIYVHQARKNNF